MVPTLIPGVPETFVSNGRGVPAGAIVLDPTGSSSSVGFVVRTSPTTNDMLVIPYNRNGLTQGDVVWTPGTSGDGSLAVTVLDNSSDPIEGAEVEVTLLAGTALTGVTYSAGTPTYSSGLTTTNALARGLTTAGGLVTLAINGTAGASMRYTVRVLGVPQTSGIGAVSPVVVSVSVTLPT